MAILRSEDLIERQKTKLWHVWEADGAASSKTCFWKRPGLLLFFTGRKRCRGVRISLGGRILALGSKSEHLGAILDTSLTETTHIGHVAKRWKWRPHSRYGRVSGRRSDQGKNETWPGHWRRTYKSDVENRTASSRTAGLRCLPDLVSPSRRQL